MSYVYNVRLEFFSTLLNGNEVLLLEPAVFLDNERVLVAILMIRGEETNQVGYVSR
jgi:hypothetical protein